MNRNDNFSLLRNDILSRGFKEKDITLSFLTQNIGALIVGLPFAALAILLFGSSQFKAFIASKPLSIFDTFIFVAILLIMFFTHEHLHALGFLPFLKNKWKSIDVWIHPGHRTPTCYFGERLMPKQYIVGTLMPLILFAILPIVIGLFLDSGLFFLLGLFNIFICGDDIIFSCAAVLFINKETYILAHPQKCGCIIYSK